MGRRPRKSTKTGPLTGDTFGERLREAIARKGWTHKGFARRIGSSHRAVGYWISGERDPGRGALLAMVDVLGVTLDDLAGVLSGQEPVFPAWAAFLATAEGATATEEELRTLRGIPWPRGMAPTIHSYRAAFMALRSAEPIVGDPSQDGDAGENQRADGGEGE